MEKKIRQIVEIALEQKLFPGCVIGVVTASGKKHVLPFGFYTFEKTAKKIHEESIFDVASITKSIPTSSLALYFIDKKKLPLKTKVKDFIPELQDPMHDETTVFHLLTQTVAIAITHSLSWYKDRTPDELLQVIYNAPLRKKPGINFLYTNATSILLGILLERVTGQSLDTLAEELLFGPLKMTKTTFHPEMFPKHEIVPTEIDSWRGLVHGTVHDESASVLQKKYCVGSAGLFSTAPDLLQFLIPLLRIKKQNRNPFLSEEMLIRMTTNQIPHLSQKTGLGWELAQERFMGKYMSAETFGKTGFTGCVIMGDMKKQVGVVILANYHYPKRKTNIAQLNLFRSQIADIVFA